LGGIGIPVVLPDRQASASLDKVDQLLVGLPGDKFTGRQILPNWRPGCVITMAMCAVSA
jgi:hypothetical protein